MKLVKVIRTNVILMISFLTFAAGAEEHGHSNAPKATKSVEAAHEDHGDDEEAGHKETEEGEEVSSAVGPEKGITEKGALGFKLSSEATKTINFRTMDYSGGNFTIPKGALVKSKNEKSVFRFRQGWIKRVPIEIQSKLPEFIVGKSSELVVGDKIIITEVGILMVSEIFSEGGASHGHSH